MSFARRCLNSEFKAWLEEEVYISDGIQHMPRKYLLLEFVEAIQSFLKKEKYTFRSTESEMVLDWARFLFKMQRGLLSKMTYAKNPEAAPEDYDMYCYLYDSQRWAGFLRAWKSVDDYSTSSKGEMALQFAPLFAWFHVNIMTSGPTQKVDEMMGIGESDEETPGPKKQKPRSDDPYLADQANAVNKMNRWD